MIKPEDFYNVLAGNEVDFFTGVPDSLLKDICAYITANTLPEKNIIAANEGGAIGLAAGYHLATGKVPLVYMQNSGIGNAVNPLASLADKKVYSIPLVLLIGWRGEPGVKDEPQHVKQGEITLEMLDVLGIPYQVLPEDSTSALALVEDSIRKAHNVQAPVALVVRKNTFEPYKLSDNQTETYSLTREAAIQILVDLMEPGDIVVSTTGMASRELFEYREKLGQGHEKDFLTVGSMGHASQIALAIALNKKERRVFCLDGDGAALMHAGSMGIVGAYAPSNYIHIVINNGAHDSVGGQPTIGFNVDFQMLAKSLMYKKALQAIDKASIARSIEEITGSQGPSLLEIRVRKGNRKDLGRPTLSPVQNKNNFTGFIR